MTTEPQSSIYNQPNWQVETVHQTLQYITQPAERPPLWIDVPSMPAHFVGREMVVAELSARLVSGDTLALSAEGQPGVGKTTLAVALAHQRAVLAHFSDGVLWAGLGTQPDLPSRLARWANALGIDISDSPTVESRAVAVRDAIGHKRLLLVIDDTWGLEAAEHLRCGGPNCVHLLTTRNQALARAFAGRSERVAELTPEDALILLRRLAAKAVAVDEAQAKGLLAAVGYLPLAVELLGGYLSAGSSGRFAEASRAALADLTDPARRLVLATRRLGDGSGKQVSLEETIALSIDGLAEESPGAVTAFYSLGAFAAKPANFDRAAAQAVAQCDADALALLSDRNLLEYDDADESLALHQTIADVARTRTIARSYNRHADYYLALIKENINNWQQIDSVYDQLQISVKRAWAESDCSLLFDFLEVLHIYQDRRGLWKDRESWIQQALVTLEDPECVGINRVYTHANLTYDLALSLLKRNEYDQSLILFWESHDLYKKLNKRIGLANTIYHLGVIAYNKNSIDEAGHLYNESLKIGEGLKYSEGIVKSLQGLAAIAVKTGDWTKAEELYVRCWNLAKGTNLSELEAECLIALGSMRVRNNSVDDARVYYQQAYDRYKSLGILRGIADSSLALGKLDKRDGKLANAKRAFEECRETYLKLGDRASVAECIHQLALIAKYYGRIDEAQQHFFAAKAIYEEIKLYNKVATTLSQLALMFHEQKQYTDSEYYYVQSLVHHLR